LIILEDLFDFLKERAKRKVAKLFLVASLPFLAWVLFAVIYSFHSTEIAYVNPISKRTLNVQLKKFFDAICLPGGYRPTAIVHPRGCSYIYGGSGLPTMYGPDKVGYWTREVHFEFKGYQDSKLELKYKILYTWPPESNRIPEEGGIVYFDLSNYTNVDQSLIVQVNPFVTYQDHLVQKIDEREPLDPKDILANDFPSWGVVISGGLLGIHGGGGSMTLGRKFSIWSTKVKGTGYLDLKNYLDYGEVKNDSFITYLLYSGAIITSLGITEIAPSTDLMKVLAIIESLLGVVLFGVITGFAYDYLKESGKRP
jgi:hypothetical protein